MSNNTGQRMPRNTIAFITTSKHAEIVDEIHRRMKGMSSATWNDGRMRGGQPFIIEYGGYRYRVLWRFRSGDDMYASYRLQAEFRSDEIEFDHVYKES